MKFSEYKIQNIPSSNLNIKKLEISGDYIFEKNEIVKRIKSTVENFLISNKDVDYLIVYYYPKYEDATNHLALCSFILNRNVETIDLTYENIYKNLIWNEYYDFLNDSKKEVKESYSNIFNEANKMLQLVEDAYFILYRLLVVINYKNPSELNDIQECLESWLIRAESLNNFFCKLKPVNYDFISFIRCMNDILYYFYISYHSGIKTIDNDRKPIINREITNAIDKFKILHQQITDFIEKHPNKETDENNFQYFLEKNFKEKREEKEI